MERLYIQPGDRYGSWSIVHELEKDKHGHRRFLCKCHQCGREKNIDMFSLVYGRSSKCRSCASKQCNVTHGFTTGKAAPEYKIWIVMKRRCGNPRFLNYQNYGGRGIKVCDRWMNSFEKFLADMGERPSDKHSIERIDVNGDYCPENCKWATRAEQSRNKRNNHQITFNGETLLLSEWAEKLQMPITTLCNRLRTYGWSVEKALTTPVNRQFASKKRQ